MASPLRLVSVPPVKYACYFLVKLAFFSQVQVFDEVDFAEVDISSEVGVVNVTI